MDVPGPSSFHSGGARHADLSRLNPRQREAVTHGAGPLLILAGAGSGKTRVITTRVAYLLERGVKPWNVLAVTFTNRAAAEMRNRIHELTGGRGAGVWISTFHSFCAQFLRMESAAVGLDRNFTIYDEDDQKKVVKDCLSELNLDEKKLKPGMIASKISREKDQLMDPESFAIAALASGDPFRQMLASIYTLYQKKLQRAGALDFGDLIMKAVEGLQNNAPLRERYQERFHHILVDEYQDTNRAQYVLTKTLAARHKNLCVVGDDDQSIYSWRGADLRNILDFEKDYEQVKVVKLEQNYRSTTPILDAAWRMVQNNERRKEKKLWTERASQTPVKVEVLANELSEAEWVTAAIRRLREEEGLRHSDFAVFYRTNAQSRVLEDALRRQEIPYWLVGNVRFYERAEVKDVLAYLRLIMNPRDDVSLKRILNVPARGIGKATLEAIEACALRHSLSLYEALAHPDLQGALGGKAREALFQFSRLIEGFRAVRGDWTVSKMVEKVLQDTRLLELLKEDAQEDLEAAARLDNVQELLNATEEFEEKSEDKGGSAYLEQVSLLTDLDSKDDKKDRVTLMTVHIAKGLEFPCVFLTGLEEGLFPLGEAQFSQEDLEEERRLAYVGMTRAKDRLFLTSAASRRLFGQTHWNVPSRFIAEAGLAEKPVSLDKDSWLGVVEPRTASGAGVEPPRPRDSASGKFRVGERVLHADFGPGRITEKSGEGEETKVIVQFDSGQWKKLLVKYAPLEKL